VSHRNSLVLVAVLVGLRLTAPGRAEEPKPDQPPLVELSQEVAALQTLYSLNLTRPQLEQLQKLAGEIAPKPSRPAEVKASATFRKRLMALRDALVKGDEERISQLADQFEAMRESELPEMDDGIDLTEEAIEEAPRVLRLLTARQVAGYLATFADDIPDPLERLLAAVDKVRGLSAKEWAEFRDEVSQEVGELLAGLDDDRAARLGDRVVQLLIVTRSLKDAEFKAQRPELEKKARAIIGDVGPTDVLRHVTERGLAELLSNPRLPAAITARLRQVKKSP
jgi:hypothetical protein